MDHLELYQGVSYKNTREKVQSLILHLSDEATTSHHHTNTMFDTNHINFRVELQEPMIIDELSDVYMEFMLSSNTKGNGISSNTSTFLLSIDQFNVNSVSNQPGSNNKIIIPNEHPGTITTDTVGHVTLHKSKKLNYVCAINPCKLYEISGKVTLLDGTTSVFFPHTEPITPNVPILTNTNTSPATAHDLGFLDLSKVLSIHAEKIGVAEDMELFIFKSANTETLKENNTLLEWIEAEHSTASSTDGETTAPGLYYDTNDDLSGGDTESKLTYTAGQLPVMHGYYWIAVGTYDSSVGTLSATKTMTNVGDEMTKGGSWVESPALNLRISNTSEVIYATVATASDNIYWFRFEHTDHSKNVVTQFNIIPRR